MKKNKDTQFKKGQTPWNKGKTGIYSEETRKKISDSKTGKKLSEETKRKLSESHKGKMPKNIKLFLEKAHEACRGRPAWNKGISPSEETKIKMSVASKGKHKSPKTEFKKGQIPWIKGKHPTNETIKKQTETLKKTLLLHPEIREKMSESRKIAYANPELRKKISETTKKAMANPELNKSMREEMKKAWANPELRKKQSESTEKYFSNHENRKRLTTDILKRYELGDFPRQENTRPEREIKAELIERGYKEGIDFIHQYKFMNKFMCDFCFPEQKIVVECDGDFWHANPKKYPEGSLLHPHQIKDVNKDKAKNAYIRTVDNHSWTLIRLWESDIKKDVKAEVDKIEKQLKLVK